MGRRALSLNLLRTQAREVELAAARAFPQGERMDIIEHLNRLRRMDAQRPAVGGGELCLHRAPLRAQHRHVLDSPPAGNQRHPLLAEELSRLG